MPQTHARAPENISPRRACSASAAWLAFVLVAPAQAVDLEGSVALRGGGTNEITDLTDFGPETYNGGWASLGGRLEVSGDLGERVRYLFAYAGFMRFGTFQTANVSQWLEQPSTLGFRIRDLPAPEYTAIGGTQDVQYRENLDRLLVKWKTDHFDLLVGRQPVSFGVVRSIRPLDFITQNLLTGLAAELRNGVDAVRVRIPTGSGMGEIDTGVVFGKNFRESESAAYLRSIMSIDRVELNLTGGRFLENNIVGAGLYTPIGDFGLRMEATWVDANGFAGVGTGDYFRGTAGVDYAFPFSRDSYVFAEYSYNGSGASSTAGVPNFIASPGYRSQSLLLWRRNYIVVGLAHQFSPTIEFQTNAIVGADDGSVLNTAAIQYNFAENWYLAGQFLAGWGDRQSEFNAYGRTLQVGLSRYF